MFGLNVSLKNAFVFYRCVRYLWQLQFSFVGKKKMFTVVRFLCHTYKNIDNKLFHPYPHKFAIQMFAFAEGQAQRTTNNKQETTNKKQLLCP